MRRRTFLASILAAGVAPAIVRADSLMRIVSRDTLVLGAPGAHGFRGPCVPLFPEELGQPVSITIPVFTGTAYWVGTDLVQPFKPEFSSSITFVGKDYADVQAQIHRYQEERHELLFGNRRDQVS